MTALIEKLEDKPITSIIGIVLSVIGVILQYYAHTHDFPGEIGAGLVAIGVALANLGRSLTPTTSNPTPLSSSPTTLDKPIDKI